MIPTVPAIERLFAQAPRVHLLIRLQCPSGPLNRDSTAVIRDFESRYAGRFSFVSKPAESAPPKEGALYLRVLCGNVELSVS